MYNLSNCNVLCITNDNISVAKKAGYEQLADLFLETANQEKEHAKIWFKEFHGIGTTEQNLIDAAAGEHEEWTNMYVHILCHTLSVNLKIINTSI